MLNRKKIFELCGWEDEEKYDVQLLLDEEWSLKDDWFESYSYYRCIYKMIKKEVGEFFFIFDDAYGDEIIYVFRNKLRIND